MYNNKIKNFKDHPLMENNINKEDVDAIIKFLKKNKKRIFTQSKKVKEFELAVAKRRTSKVGFLVLDKKIGEETLNMIKDIYDSFIHLDINIKQFKIEVRNLDLIKQFNNNQKFIKITTKKIIIFIDELRGKDEIQINLINRLKSLLKDLKIL